MKQKQRLDFTEIRDFSTAEKKIVGLMYGESLYLVHTDCEVRRYWLENQKGDFIKLIRKDTALNLISKHIVKYDDTLSILKSEEYCYYRLDKGLFEIASKIKKEYK